MTTLGARIWVTPELPFRPLQRMEAVVATPKSGANLTPLSATEKKWSVRKSILFAFVMSAVLWALIILGIRQIF